MMVSLYFKLVGIAMRSQMQYRASFFMLLFSYFLSTFIDIMGIWVLFDRFKIVQGWTLSDVALLYGIMNMGFSIAETSARGFDTFDRMIKTGDFDRVLLRPVGTLFQIATREVQLMRLGRFFQGLCILLWGASQLGIVLFSHQTLLILWTIVGTACLFYGLIVMQATICFWTTESLEVMNITTFGGLECGQYPMSLYAQWFRWFFTFIIPLACVAYYPVATTLHHEALPQWSAFVFPLAGVIFLGIASQFWKVGVRHYRSTGS